MPHLIVRLWLGPSEQQKARLAEALTISCVVHFEGEYQIGDV
jgi:phenylpyruvate tautomerase PptA (4-oxalocrotonate tautomerase family)